MKSATQGGFDLAFEVVGSGDALTTCLDGVRPGGTSWGVSLRTCLV